MKKLLILLLTGCLVFSLAGCRRRLTETKSDTLNGRQTQTAPPMQEKNGTGDGPGSQTAPEPTQKTEARPSGNAADSVQNVKKSTPVPAPSKKSGSTPVKDDTGTGGTITETRPSDETGGQTKPSDQGGAVGTIVDAYSKILNDGLGSLYECQKGFVYLEGTEDHQTFNRSGDEQMLILDSGGYNVAERLPDGDLVVSDDWVVRKNPTVIVKLTDGDVLGAGVTDTSSAETLRSELTARPGWGGISAVINNNVVLLSRQLFDSDEGKLYAKLMIAKEMYPTLFTNVDMSGLTQQLKDAGGKDYSDGIYVYP